jgi:hypothetical protein
LRTLLQTTINMLPSADADQVVGAEYGVATPGRVTQRNGYRTRPLDTRVGTIDVQVHPDGHLSLKDTEFLAGAGHLLNWDIAHFINTTGTSLAETIRLCTTNPGALLNLPETADFELQPGSRANLTCFSFTPGDAELRIHETISAGTTIWKNR